MKKTPDNQSMASDSPPSLHKAFYVKPSFRHEQVFETMALACGKVDSTQGACKSVKKNS